MKKQYLQNMDVSKIKNIIINNYDFIAKMTEWYVIEKGQDQQAETELIIGKDFYNYIEVKDHYNTWFFILKDWEKFIDNVNTQYLDVDELYLYNGIIGGIKERDALEYLSDKWVVMDERLELESKELLHSIEAYLHTFEEYTTEDVINYVIELELYNNYYILDNNEKILYLDITKSFK